MTSRDAFALQHSDLSAFLFAEVGTERGGMTLTVVSVIARLGEDPWKEARRLSTLPKAAAIDTLARIIECMPTSPWALADATAIATRLVLLLPTNPRVSRPSTDWPSSGLSIPQWVRMLLLYGALGAWLAINAFAFHGHSAVDNGTTEQVGTRDLQASETRPSAQPTDVAAASLNPVSAEGTSRR